MTDKRIWPTVSYEEYPIIQDYIIKQARKRYGDNAYTLNQDVMYRGEVIKKR